MKYLILDTETSGLGSKSGVVELACLQIDPDNLEVLGEFSTLCNPGVPIEAGAFAVHGISDADVADAFPVEHVFKPEGPTTVIGHNVSFDLRFLSKCIADLQGSLCTLALARQYITDAPNHKLGILAKHLNLETGKAHRALGDVYTTRNLLKYLIEKSGRSLVTHVKVATMPKIIHRMPFGKYKGQLLINIPKEYLEWFLKQEIDRDLRKSLETCLKVR